MADIQLNSVTLATESGGTVVLDSAVQDNITRLGTVASGVIGSAVTGTIGTGVALPTGCVVQIVQGGTQAKVTTAGTTARQDITGFNASITPKQAGSQILIHWAYMHCTSNAVTSSAYMQRVIGSGSWADLSGAMGTDPGGSLGDPAIGHTGGSTSESWNSNNQAGSYLDSPSYTLTEEISYKIGSINENANDAIVYGSTVRDSTGYHPRSRSMLILMEVAG